MAHVVAEPCFDCKYTDCVVVCPVDCFYEGAQMLYIHPEECIDCEACVPECPVEAIFHEDNLPDDWKEFTALNAEESPKCPVITEKKDALEGESCTQGRVSCRGPASRGRSTPITPAIALGPGGGIHETSARRLAGPRSLASIRCFDRGPALRSLASRRPRSPRRRCGSSA